MASSTLITKSTKLIAQIGTETAKNTRINSTQLLAAAGRRIHASSRQDSSVCEQARETKENIKESTSSAADHVTQKTKDVAGEVSEKARDAVEKAKQTVENAWVSTKDAAQRAKETVENRADVSKEYVKQHAGQVQKGMNTKGN
ncbi:hypothetical protein L484_015097 [Morus notabilis]|uniref:Uncharacterized protein n=1 Tax=Morus notabilis TaxID=981085 RepID=W9SEW4_9ROSA|nr:late embryogenesis abundant protein 76 [Morus notabilis]EXC29905.1 hypothetical protein L484_015097 [Morus notabilis]